MKTEILSGPREWGIRYVREESDGLAWDVTAAVLRRLVTGIEDAWLDECARLLREAR